MHRAPRMRLVCGTSASAGATSKHPEPTTTRRPTFSSRFLILYINNYSLHPQYNISTAPTHSQLQSTNPSTQLSPDSNPKPWPPQPPCPATPTSISS